MKGTMRFCRFWHDFIILIEKNLFYIKSYFTGPNFRPIENFNSLCYYMSQWSKPQPSVGTNFLTALNEFLAFFFCWKFIAVVAPFEDRYVIRTIRKVLCSNGAKTSASILSPLRFGFGTQRKNPRIIFSFVRVGHPRIALLGTRTRQAKNRLALLESRGSSNTERNPIRTGSNKPKRKGTERLKQLINIIVSIAMRFQYKYSVEKCLLYTCRSTPQVQGNSILPKFKPRKRDWPQYRVERLSNEPKRPWISEDARDIRSPGTWLTLLLETSRTLWNFCGGVDSLKLLELHGGNKVVGLARNDHVQPSSWNVWPIRNDWSLLAPVNPGNTHILFWLGYFRQNIYNHWNLRSWYVDYDQYHTTTRKSKLFGRSFYRVFPQKKKSKLSRPYIVRS